MANYALRCDEPSEVIDQVIGLLNGLSETKDAVTALNAALGEHVDNIGVANGKLVSSMQAIGGKAMLDTIDNQMGVIHDSLLIPVFDAYIMMYGMKHEKDTRADM